MKAGRSLLATALVAVVLVFFGCGPFFGPEAGPGAPEISPSSGTYTESFSVSIQPSGNQNNSNSQVYYTTNPETSFLEYQRLNDNDNIYVDRNLTIQAYCLDDRGLRSPIARADYVLEFADTTAPAITSTTLWQSNSDYFWFDIEWDASEPDPDRAIESNPVDDQTDWYNLDFAVYASPQNNIGTLEEAQTNGTLVKEWHSRNTSSEFPRAHYETSAAGERRYVNVFVRDAAGNASAYGSVRMESRVAPADIYLGRLASVDDVWLNSFYGNFLPAPIGVPVQLDDTYAAALADLNDDGFDDLVAGYETGGVHYLGWFKALGNGTFKDTAEAVIAGLPSPVTDIEVADMNQDGEPDIVAANNTATVGVYGLDFSLLFSAAATGADRLTVGDINGDGFPDLVTANAGGPVPVGVWINGSGTALTLEDQPWYGGAELLNPADVVLAELNGDEFADLIIAPVLFKPEIFYGSSTKEMIPEIDEEWMFYLGTTKISTADWDQDGWTDILFSNNRLSPPNIRSRIYRNIGPDVDGNPEFAMGFEIWYDRTATGAVVADVNGDSLPDFIEIYQGDQAIVWLNNDGATFSEGIWIGSGDETAIAAGRLR